MFSSHLWVGWLASGVMAAVTTPILVLLWRRFPKKRGELLRVLIPATAYLSLLPTVIPWVLSDIKPPDETAAYQEQLTKLTDVENSLANLKTFVHEQKEHLANSQSILDGLNAKHDKLKQVVSHDESVVNAVLDVYQERQQNNVWRERAIGFLIGILSSLIASVIYRLCTAKIGNAPRGLLLQRAASRHSFRHQNKSRTRS